MLRALAAVSTLGLLALALLAGLGQSGSKLAGWNEPGAAEGPMIHARTGEPITLETVARDLEWHRETARKLRDLK